MDFLFDLNARQATNYRRNATVSPVSEDQTLNFFRLDFFRWNLLSGLFGRDTRVIHKAAPTERVRARFAGEQREKNVEEVPKERRETQPRRALALPFVRSSR